MLKPLLVLALSCLSLSAAAQDEPNYKQSRISLGVGLANPVGDLGDDNWKDRNPPFAKTGTLFSFGYSKGLGKHFAIGGTFARRSNAYNSGEYLAYRKDTNSSYTKASGSSWVSNFILGDIYLKAPARGATLYAKVSLGMAYNTSAEYELRSAFTRANRHEGKARSLGYGLAGGVQFEAGRFGLELEGGLLATAPAFEVKYTYFDSEPRPDQTRTETLEQDMKTLNFSAKVSYSF